MGCNWNDGCTCEPRDEDVVSATEQDGFHQPLSLLLVDRDGVGHLVDGRMNETREYLTGDRVERAAWIALLQEALRMLQQPRATGGFTPGIVVPDRTFTTPTLREQG